MIWFLIIIVINSEATAVRQVEFNTESACLDAKGKIEAETGKLWTQVFAICAPKGDR